MTTTFKHLGRQFDITIWGSTGFTGQLVVGYLSKKYPSLKIAIAGRNKDKLTALKRRLGLSSSVEIFAADLSNSDEIDAITSNTKVLISMAGPYALIGSNVVESCVRSKTDYCDITGEGQWVKKMIQAHHKTASEAGVRIVHCCGFDCIPSDLGCFMMVNEMKRRGLRPERVRYLVGESDGGVSGGTIASAFNIVESSSFEELKALADPFSLCELSTSDREQIHSNVYSSLKDKSWCEYDSNTGLWIGPFIMQAIDTRVVHRSNALSGWSYGRNFIYDEGMILPNQIIANLFSLVYNIGLVSLLLPFVRALVRRLLPKPGEGPGQDKLDNGFFKIKFWAQGQDANGVPTTIHGGVDAFSGDPGYRQTAKMVAETALCLLESSSPDEGRDGTVRKVGVLTPSIACGEDLLRRLRNAGMRFFVVE